MMSLIFIGTLIYLAWIADISVWTSIVITCLSGAYLYYRLVRLMVKILSLNELPEDIIFITE